jgi:uncharacterized protein (DUF1810 family)
MNDSFDLQRFIDAQKMTYDAACRELAAGRKRSHWMWFIFPQIKGLGHSDMARKYALSSIDEADAYLNHPILGPRLRHCSQLVADIHNSLIEDVFGYPDNMKFHSSMTLFAQAKSTHQNDHIFDTCLKKYFGGKQDAATLNLLSS